MRWRQPDKYPLARWLSSLLSQAGQAASPSSSSLPKVRFLLRGFSASAAAAETTTVSPRIGRNATLARKQAPAASQPSARNFFLLAFRTHTNTMVMMLMSQCLFLHSNVFVFFHYTQRLTDQRCDLFFGAKNVKTQRAVGERRFLVCKRVMNWGWGGATLSFMNVEGFEE
jgi:hypothetical protein